jgi:hypothetical protein
MSVAIPITATGVPSPLMLGHQGINLSRSVHHIMGTYRIGGGLGEQLKGQGQITFCIVHNEKAHLLPLRALIAILGYTRDQGWHHGLCSLFSRYV